VIYLCVVGITAVPSNSREAQVKVAMHLEIVIEYRKAGLCSTVLELDSNSLSLAGACGSAARRGNWGVLIPF
jgi:hypothetical protein